MAIYGILLSVFRRSAHRGIVTSWHGCAMRAFVVDRDRQALTVLPLGIAVCRRLESDRSACLSQVVVKDVTTYLMLRARRIGNHSRHYSFGKQCKSHNSRCCICLCLHCNRLHPWHIPLADCAPSFPPPLHGKCSMLIPQNIKWQNSEVHKIRNALSPLSCPATVVSAPGAR